MHLGIVCHLSWQQSFQLIAFYLALECMEIPTSKGWSWLVQLPGKNIAFMVLKNVFFESAAQ
jgi:hypothetical protein